MFSATSRIRATYAFSVLLGLCLMGTAIGQEEGTYSVLTDEPITHLKEFQRRLDFLAARLKEIPADPDATTSPASGAISLAQHAADVAAVRDEFVMCLGAMKKKIADKEESGTATEADRAEFKKCLDQCDAVLGKLNNMHVNATMIGSADHKTTWVVDGLAKHRKQVEEVQALAAQCPEMMMGAVKCAEMHKGEGAAAPAVAAGGANSVTTDSPIAHLKEFQRKLDWLKSRLGRVEADPAAAADPKSDAISLKQHSADIAATRDEFVKCVASMKKSIADKKESGTATKADEEQFDKCLSHCKKILEKLNNMHMNATVLGSADHKTNWVVDGLAKHKKAVAEISELAAQCPEMIHATMKCCETKHDGK